MFIFARVFHTPVAEKIDILLPIDAFPEATARFGKPLYRNNGPGHHEVGTLILLHGQEEGRKTVEVFLAGHDAMTEEERASLRMQALNFLSDKEYMGCGGFSDFKPRWVLEDHRYEPDAREQQLKERAIQAMNRRAAKGSKE